MIWQDCNRCKHELKESNESPCDKCSYDSGDGYEPKTNADAIRNMSDEELARHIANDFDMVCNEIYENSECNDNCIRCVLKWLQAEVKEGNSNENT